MLLSLTWVELSDSPVQVTISAQAARIRYISGEHFSPNPEWGPLAWENPSTAARVIAKDREARIGKKRQCIGGAMGEPRSHNPRHDHHYGFVALGLGLARLGCRRLRKNLRR